MTSGTNIDGVLVTWGDRLFYPGNRMVKGSPSPKLTGDALRKHAAHIRSRIAATVRRAPQVMVKVTGGGRGMRAITAHFRYISKNGRLDIEDDRGEIMQGPDAVRFLADDWRFSGGLISEEPPDGGRREAFNIMLSMPRGTDPLAVQRAAREFARVELAGHKYVMVLHDHQANPHVHVSVRAEGREGRRLYPRKANLRRWREVFAGCLRDLGIDADATKRSIRGGDCRVDKLWHVKAVQRGWLRTEERSFPLVAGHHHMVGDWSIMVWRRLREVLERSSAPQDYRLAAGIATLLAQRESVQSPVKARETSPREHSANQLER